MAVNPAEHGVIGSEWVHMCRGFRSGAAKRNDSTRHRTLIYSIGITLYSSPYASKINVLRVNYR